MDKDGYDWADNAKSCYDLAIDTMRKQLESFRCEHIGPHKLYLGDCREVMPLLPKVDAVVTDPPYGIGFPYNGYEDTEENLHNLVGNYVPLCRQKASRVVITPGVSNITIYPRPDWVASWTWG